MKIPFLFGNDIQADIRKEHLASEAFKEDLVLQNICRGKLLAIVVIAIEIVFLLIVIISYFLKVSDAFSFFSYSVMYSIMIAINLAFLFLIHCFGRNRIHTKTMYAFITLYITLVMAWGSVISLMDQGLYGHLMGFMVNMIVCSIIYLMDARLMSIPYLASVLILAIGLPFFQSSSNVLIGHYANLFVFIVISWLASRIAYRSYCDNYVINKLMIRSKLLLEKEMEENGVINKKLAIANAQLKQLALVDELTGLSNRRSFREFIDKVFQSNADTNLTVSVVMIDIDFFKQYNDSYGHEKGDLALIAVAEQIDAMVENTDQLAVRWGGEEFIYAAFNKSQKDALESADALRLKILGLKIPNQSSSINPYISISLGTCTGTVASAKNISGVIKIADQALYLAKKGGRNCVAALAYNEYSDGETDSVS